MLTIIARLIARFDNYMFQRQSARRVDRMFRNRGWEIAPANDNSPARKGA